MRCKILGKALQDVPAPRLHGNSKILPFMIIMEKISRLKDLDAEIEIQYMHSEILFLLDAEVWVSLSPNYGVI